MAFRPCFLKNRGPIFVKTDSHEDLPNPPRTAHRLHPVGVRPTRIPGTLLRGMHVMLSRARVRLLDFRKFVVKTSERAKKPALAEEERAGRSDALPRVAKGRARRDLARILDEQPLGKAGAVCAFTALELCISFEYHRSSDPQALGLEPRPRKCQHIYKQYLHPMFGVMSARLQTCSTCRLPATAESGSRRSFDAAGSISSRPTTASRGWQIRHSRSGSWTSSSAPTGRPRSPRSRVRGLLYSIAQDDRRRSVAIGQGEPTASPSPRSKSSARSQGRVAISSPNAAACSLPLYRLTVTPA